MKRILNVLQKLEKIAKEGGEIYIRCAGKFGQDVLNSLSEIDIPIAAFLDASYSRTPEVAGIPVLSPKIVSEKKRSSYFVLIAIEGDERYSEICDELSSFGLRPYEDFCDFSFVPELHKRMRDFRAILPEYDFYKGNRALADSRNREMQEVIPSFFAQIPNAYNLIANLDVPLTTYCSLHCNHCSHCIPYANPPRHFDAQLLIEDLEKVLSVSYITCVAIMGGEPLLYPSLLAFLEGYRALRNSDHIGFTRIITNGTILPDDAFFEAIKKVDNCYISFSNYGEKSKKLTSLIEKCNKYQIPYYVCPESTEWLLLGDFDYDRNYTEDQMKHLFAVCDAHYCTQMFDGRIYSCARAPLLNEDGLIPFGETDYCEVRRVSEDGLREHLHRYLYETPYLNACRYCDGAHMCSRRIKRGD